MADRARPKPTTPEPMTGADIVLKALVDQGVEVMFGYPGGAVLPIYEALYVARSGRPGPVVVDLPKDIQLAKGPYTPPDAVEHKSYRPRRQPEPDRVAEAVALLAKAKRPLIYAGGGVINSGPRASELL